MTPLRWLDFDYSEGTDDTGVFDALASVLPQHAESVEAEIAQVLAWAESSFPGRRGPLHEGGEWDADAQMVEEEAKDGAARLAFALTLSGTLSFCEAFRARFGASEY
ncbi:MAG: hypothetical protein EOO24_29725 [Comamonadaceae bacterium]|nr:MAG: hypothetical protein EOO24_29725 [Comamonadaceae bacterium]